MTKKHVAAVIMILIIMVGCSRCNRYFGLDDNHPMEEFLEEIIKAKSGIDLDLTPLSPEDHA